MVANPSSSASNRALMALGLWHGMVTRSLKTMPYDLSARQMGVLLSVYLEPGPHSIKRLSEDLFISKPAVCRAVDTLERLKFLKRQRDPSDKRNVLLSRTVKGSAYLGELSNVIIAALKAAA